MLTAVNIELMRRKSRLLYILCNEAQFETIVNPYRNQFLILALVAMLKFAQRDCLPMSAFAL